jgi:hypothetical protein
LALLAGMQQQEGGGGNNHHCGGGTQMPNRPDSRDEQSLGLAMSEAMATLEDSNDSSVSPSISCYSSNLFSHSIPVGPFVGLRLAFCMPSKMVGSFHSEPPPEVGTIGQREAEADAMKLIIITTTMILTKTTTIMGWGEEEEEGQSQRWWSQQGLSQTGWRE